LPKAGDSLLSLVAQIVIAQVQHNETPRHALPGLIRDVYRALANAGETTPRPPPAVTAPEGQTVFEDHLICMDCGAHMKMLKRHLQTVHDTTPAQYRAKWNLAGDYPMVARQYAALRSSLARDSGLGKRPVPRSR